MSNYEYASVRFDMHDAIDVKLLDALDCARTPLARASYVKQLLWVALVEEEIGNEPNI